MQASSLLERSHTMVLVFRTNIETAEAALHIVETLLMHYPDHRINVDLEDCDRVLRVEGSLAATHPIISLVLEQGFFCEELED